MTFPLNVGAFAHLQELVEAEGEPPICPLGDGYGIPLGTLGRLAWHRCRACGLDFSTPANQED
jgi:hypothetical protein